MGLIIGMLPLTSKAAALAVNVMLDRQGLLAGAHEAAKANDDDLLWRYISEAMRIAPQSPGQFRLSDEIWRIGPNNNHEIPSGTRVFAATQSAMFDRRTFPSAVGDPRGPPPPPVTCTSGTACTRATAASSAAGHRSPG